MCWKIDQDKIRSVEELCPMGCGLERLVDRTPNNSRFGVYSRPDNLLSRGKIFGSTPSLERRGSSDEIKSVAISDIDCRRQNGEWF